MTGGVAPSVCAKTSLATGRSPARPRFVPCVGIRSGGHLRRRDARYRPPPRARPRLAIVAGGISLGAVGALVASRLLETLLFGVATTDAATYALVAFVLLAVAATASALARPPGDAHPPQVTLCSE